MSEPPSPCRLAGLPISKAVQLTGDHHRARSRHRPNYSRRSACADTASFGRGSTPGRPEAAPLSARANFPRNSVALPRDQPWTAPDCRNTELAVRSSTELRRAAPVTPRCSALAAEPPAPILADLLGLHITTATRWVGYARRDWSIYLAARAEDLRARTVTGGLRILQPTNKCTAPILRVAQTGDLPAQKGCG